MKAIFSPTVSSVIVPHYYIHVLPPKAPFSTWPWEQTSCLHCVLRVNFFLPFDLGHFEYYLAWLIVVVLPAPFGLVIWVETTTDFGLVTLVLLLVSQNESICQHA